jgi:hypothetical protein
MSNTEVRMRGDDRRPEDVFRSIRPEQRGAGVVLLLRQNDAADGSPVSKLQRRGLNPVHRRATFPCPLCRALGRVVTVVAELEPEPPLVTVIDVQGTCAHANGFGQLDQLTLEQEWELIEAALDAASGAAS